MSDKALEDTTTPQTTEDQDIEDALAKMAESEAVTGGDEDGVSPAEDGANEKQQQAEAQPEEKPETIPLSVGLEWKRDAKALRQEVTELRSQLQEVLSTVKGVTTAPDEEPPSLSESPVEHLAYQSQQVKQQIADLRAALDESKQANQQQSIQHQIDAAEAAYAAKQPDYYEATNFLAQRRLAELQDTFGMSEREAQERFSEDMARFIQAAANRGANFAEEAYKLAQNLGFKAAAPAEVKGDVPGGDGVQAKADAAKESLKEIARKQQQARTLASTNGQVKSGELTPGDAAEMSDEEFDKLFTGEGSDKRLKEVFGA